MLVVPLSVISVSVPEWWYRSILSLSGVSSNSNMWPDSDSYTWPYGYSVAYVFSGMDHTSPSEASISATPSFTSIILPVGIFVY